MCFNYKDWRNNLKDTISGFKCSHLITLHYSSDNCFFQHYSIPKEKSFRHYHIQYDRRLVVYVTVLYKHIEQVSLTYTLNLEGGIPRNYHLFDSHVFFAIFLDT